MRSHPLRIPRLRPRLTVGHVRCLMLLGVIAFWVVVARLVLS